MIRISNVKLSLDENVEKLRKIIIKKLRIKESDLSGYTIFKESIDARKGKIEFVYTVDVDVKNEAKILEKNKDNNIRVSPNKEYRDVECGNEQMENRPVIVGMGPSGLFASLLLAQRGYKPIVLERGNDVDKRSEDVEKFWSDGELDEESNVQFGEGGAGTFSDGKLTTRIKDMRCRKVLKELVHSGAPGDILYTNKPHVGTDILKGVVKDIRNRIIELGGEVRFATKAESFIMEGGQVKGLVLSNGEIIESNNVVLALGHSARDTYEKLYESGVKIIQKPFAIGVRIEHPQIIINKAQYKEHYSHERLGAAEYALIYHTKDDDRTVYTFCMCPGGKVIASSSKKGCLVTNGMSEHARSEINANSAVLVNVYPEDFESDHPLAGVYFQEKYEKMAFELGGSDYKAPVQLVGDFINKRKSVEIGEVKPSYEPGYVLSDLSKCLPSFVSDSLREGIAALESKLKGFSMDDAVLTGVETRSSSPIRIKRDEVTLESENIKGLYPCGEGAGYAGGIMSAAVDGIKVAEMIIKKHSPLTKN